MNEKVSNYFQFEKLMMKESDSWSQVLVVIKDKSGGLSISGPGVVYEAARYLRAATEKEMISTSAKSVW